MSEFENKCGDDSNKLEVQEEEQTTKQTKISETDINEINKINEIFKTNQTLFNNFKKEMKKYKSKQKPIIPQISTRETYTAQISDELATFLRMPLKTRMTRIVATEYVFIYIEVHNLRPEKGRNGCISPDTALIKLFNLKEGDKLRLIDIQRYMASHFTKYEKISNT